MKLTFQLLTCTSHISGAQQPCVAGGCHAGRCGQWAFLPGPAGTAALGGGCSLLRPVALPPPPPPLTPQRSEKTEVEDGPEAFSGILRNTSSRCPPEKGGGESSHGQSSERHGSEDVTAEP